MCGQILTKSSIISNTRRYARALMGSQESGDLYVRVCLGSLAGGTDPASGGIRCEAWPVSHIPRCFRPQCRPGADAGELVDLSIEARLRALPASERQILLLTSLEGFSTTDAATILGIPLR